MVHLKKKTDRPKVEMETSEGDWEIFKYGWERYKRMTMLTDPVRVLDKLRECCGKQLNTRLIQLYGQEELDKGDEKKILGLIK